MNATSSTLSRLCSRRIQAPTCQRALSGSPDVFVGHERPGRTGTWSARLSMARAMTSAYASRSSPAWRAAACMRCLARARASATHPGAWSAPPGAPPPTPDRSRGGTPARDPRAVRRRAVLRSGRQRPANAPRRSAARPPSRVPAPTTGRRHPPRRPAPRPDQDRPLATPRSRGRLAGTSPASHHEQPHLSRDTTARIPLDRTTPSSGHSLPMPSAHSRINSTSARKSVPRSVRSKTIAISATSARSTPAKPRNANRTAVSGTMPV